MSREWWKYLGRIKISSLDGNLSWHNKVWIELPSCCQNSVYLMTLRKQWIQRLNNKHYRINKIQSLCCIHKSGKKDKSIVNMFSGKRIMANVIVSTNFAHVGIGKNLWKTRPSLLHAEPLLKRRAKVLDLECPEGSTVLQRCHVLRRQYGGKAHASGVEFRNKLVSQFHVKNRHRVHVLCTAVVHCERQCL